MKENEFIQLPERGNNILKSFGIEDNNFEKGGEGSRGGQIIGHTTTGKPIYAGHNSHLTTSEHTEARNKLHHFEHRHFKNKKEVVEQHYYKTREEAKKAMQSIGTDKF